ncbi:MAG TPA: sigma factor-like helix-turn-helix DNA-binding protein [Ktedonosporobacter sp.]|nr:sigma factor-like helix-turn-helix DNA-binding protein [Ktedonosporobacter sp.]
MINLNDPTLDERLRRRTAEKRYEISEIELVVTIRALLGEGNMTGVRRLCEVLLQRCAPIFQRHTDGLKYRPELREEAIANMGEHLLRDIQNARETFITQNFIVHVRRLCIDEFNAVLRQEGLDYKRDKEGRPIGQPNHIPRALIGSLQPAPADDEGLTVADVADPRDQYEHINAEVESQRILLYLEDPLDRMIMVLRAVEKMKWDDIAEVCKRTERTVRLRYERARSYLRECLSKEQQFSYTPAVHQP